jgi:two-component system phosphate regulon sensor histidine kinase PhoR
MTFEIVEPARADGTQDETETPIAHTAILDFGFGDLIVHLKEMDPARIPAQIVGLRNSYAGIIVVAAVAVMLALVSLWRNARAQLKLAERKDDFISAVSHELRTPLTSIRMYAEMLEKNWVKSKDKLTEYYRNMRAESERLSRLVENVLDFSRLQKGRKRYSFAAGDINQCVGEAVEMMRPYAEQQGFSIQTELADLGATTFDKDAVTQIVVNLLDNGIKYGRGDDAKTIFVRTTRRGRFTMIEVEDRGPGVPRRQHKRIFEQFYRWSGPLASGSQVSGPEVTGTGLGLALVKRFAEAHNGFVEVASAAPTGAIFRVALAEQA